MQKAAFIHLPPRPGPETKGIVVVAGITAISFAAAWAFEQHRQRKLVRVLASMPGAIGIFPALRVHSEMVLKQFRVDVPPKPNSRKP